MYIIDTTFFTDYLDVPNTNEPDSKSADELIRRIDEKGRLFINSALGSALQAVLDPLLVNGILPNDNTVPQKWRNLVYGCTYTTETETRYWKGLVRTEGSFKGSMMAGFIYYHYLNQNTSYVSGVGEVKAEAKNAPTVNSTQRLTTVWNEFVRAYQGNYRNEGESIWFGNWDWYDWTWCPSVRNDDVSLLQFLSENETDYPSARKKAFGIKNQLGL